MIRFALCTFALFVAACGVADYGMAPEELLDPGEPGLPLMVSRRQADTYASPTGSSGSQWFPDNRYESGGGHSYVQTFSCKLSVGHDADIRRLCEPRNFTVTLNAAGTHLDLDWDKPDDNDVDGHVDHYVVHYDSTNIRNGTGVVVGGNTSYAENYPDSTHLRWAIPSAYQTDDRFRRLWFTVGARRSGGEHWFRWAPATRVSVPRTTNTDTDRVYRLAAAEPSAPTGGESTLFHTPSGWQRAQPDATPTEDVWKAERTRTYVSGSFTSATAWGNVTKVADRIAVTTNVQTIYKKSASQPSVPTGDQAVENDAPSGWQANAPAATPTEAVYKTSRTRTYHDGVFETATVWGPVRLHQRRSSSTPDPPTPVTHRLNAPSGLTATVGSVGSRVELSWSGASNSGYAFTYALYSASSRGGTYSRGGTRSGTSATVSIGFNQTRCFKVSAWPTDSRALESASSNAACATTGQEPRNTLTTYSGARHGNWTYYTLDGQRRGETSIRVDLPAWICGNNGVERHIRDDSNSIVASGYCLGGTDARDGDYEWVFVTR